MYVIECNSVNEALSKGLNLMSEHGEEISSRNGMTLEVPAPVATVYHQPANRVLISSARDANPFFHLMEALWIIAGREDVAFLNEFNKRMVEYSDNGETFNAPYGYRVRNHFGMDQIDLVIDTLFRDPNSRQAVLQIWDPADLGRSTKDKACNMQVVFRVRKGKLDMTVNNRSNDMIWGAYGANVVQFSMLQEYVAAHLDLPMGTYTQVSNSFHVYTEGPGGEVLRRVVAAYDKSYNPYDHVHMRVNMTRADIVDIELDLKMLFSMYDCHGLQGVANIKSWNSMYFEFLVIPMLQVYMQHKEFGPEVAIANTQDIKADDWRMAAVCWLDERIARRNAK